VLLIRKTACGRFSDIGLVAAGKKRGPLVDEDKGPLRWRVVRPGARPGGRFSDNGFDAAGKESSFCRC
jgi:hypothetical protein